MTTALECRAIYQQLVRMLQELEMDEVIRSVEEEWITLEALTAEEYLLHEGKDAHPPITPSPNKKRRKPSTPSSATQFPLGFDEEEQYGPDRADTTSIPIDERLYPPQRRVLLLINATEQALAQPTVQGLAVMDMLDQDELLFKDPQHPERDFTLSRATLQHHEPDALALLNSLRALAHYIDPTGEINV